MKRFSTVEVVLSVLIIFMTVLGIAVGVHLRAYPPSARQSTSFATTPPRLPDTFRFDPKPDMTNYELALTITMMMGGMDYLDRIKPVYDAMPPEVQRHWLPPEPKK